MNEFIEGWKKQQIANYPPNKRKQQLDIQKLSAKVETLKRSLPKKEIKNPDDQEIFEGILELLKTVVKGI